MREGPPFPINLRTKSQEFISQILPLEKEGRKNRKGERVHGRRGRLCSGAKEREGEGEGIFMPTNSRTKRLNYP